MKAQDEDIKLIALLLRVDDGEQSMKIVSAYVAAAEAWLENAGVANKFSYISTAGGAFLEWMEGKELPGVAVLKK